MATSVALLAIDLRDAPVEVLEALTLDGPEIDAVIRTAKHALGEIELVIVSDARRFELTRRRRALRPSSAGSCSSWWRGRAVAPTLPSSARSRRAGQRSFVT
jgi:hypothetical protein